MYASIGNKHFFLKHIKIRTFKSHFSVLKIGRIFPLKISMKNIGLGDQFLLENVFENFDI